MKRALLAVAALALWGCEGEIYGFPTGPDVPDAGSRRPAGGAGGSGGGGVVALPGGGTGGTGGGVAGGVGGGTGGGTPAVIPTSPLMRSTLLTRSQYRGLVSALLGGATLVNAELPEDLAVEGFSQIGGGALTLNVDDVERYRLLGEKLAAAAMADPSRRAQLAGCMPSANDDAVCAGTAVAKLGKAFFRRELTSTEKTRLVALVTTGGKTLVSFWSGLELALSSMLSSPKFLYLTAQTEADPADATRVRYTSRFLAHRLALAVWAGPPDAELLRAGDAGELVVPDNLAAQVRRMWTQPQTQAALKVLLNEWLELRSLENAPKDITQFPQWTPELRADLAAETERFFIAVTLDDDADLRELFTRTETWVTPRLAQLYGLPMPSGQGLTKVSFPATSRRLGVLTQGSLLASHARNQTSPTLRGKLLRTRLLCEHIAPPPANVDVGAANVVDNAVTRREQMLAITANAQCQACHVKMDPLGFGLEHFDALGRERSLDNGKPIDASGALEGRSYDGPRTLVTALTEAKGFDRCAALQVRRFVLGRVELTAEAPAIDQLGLDFTAKGRRLRGLFETLVRSDAFRFAPK